MKVTERTARTVTTHTVDLQLEADVSEHLGAPYRQGMFKPDRLTIIWRREGDGEWALDRCSTNGFMVKKNGEPGQQRNGRTFTNYSGALAAETMATEGTPDWVRQLVQENQP